MEDSHATAFFGGCTGGWRSLRVGALPGSVLERPINNGIPMNKTSIGFGIAKRLYAVSALISLGLAALAVYAWVSLHQAAEKAAFTEKNRVAQLNAMAELELNVTQTSLQLRHAMLARNPQELQDTLLSLIHI